MHVPFLSYEEVYMAVTRGRNVILMTANADAVTDDVIIQTLHATGAVAGVVETDNNPLGSFGAAGTINLSRPIYAKGLKRGSGAGHLYAYIA
jgi:hypothetical protein